MTRAKLVREPATYLLVPLPKNPYSRIGSRPWQDWYRQIKRTITVARELTGSGNAVRIAILSNFQPKGQASEIEIYSALFAALAPDLTLDAYRETNGTFGQVKRSFELAEETKAHLVFISTWMHYPRVLYRARGKGALHYGAFGIPQPAFALIDPLCIILEPLADILGVGNFFRRIIIRQREKGRIL